MNKKPGATRCMTPLLDGGIWIQASFSSNVSYHQHLALSRKLSCVGQMGSLFPPSRPEGIMRKQKLDAWRALVLIGGFKSPLIDLGIERTHLSTPTLDPGLSRAALPSCSRRPVYRPRSYTNYQSLSFTAYRIVTW